MKLISLQITFLCALFFLPFQWNSTIALSHENYCGLNHGCLPVVLRFSAGDNANSLHWWCFSLGSWPLISLLRCDCFELSSVGLCPLHSLHYQSPDWSKIYTNYTISLLASARESVISAPVSKRQADPIIIPLLIQFCVHGALWGKDESLFQEMSPYKLDVAHGMTTVKWLGKEYILIYEFIERFCDKSPFCSYLVCPRYTTQTWKIRNCAQNGARPIPFASLAFL